MNHEHEWDSWTELIQTLRDNADDEINKANGAAAGYQNALYLVEAHRDRINAKAVRRGARMALAALRDKGEDE